MKGEEIAELATFVDNLTSVSAGTGILIEGAYLTLPSGETLTLAWIAELEVYEVKT